MDHEVESGHSLPHQEVLKGSTYPTTLRSRHIVFSMAPVVKHLLNRASTQFAMQIMMYCPEVVRCPGDVARQRGDDTGGKAARRVEDVADIGGEGGVATTVY
ncbi:uncharacterized protein [Triticum aestivum]|uniref:uncharacterized protein n=1 Tax=Triticum aestivum TaxID=4565 RepID=UPI001D012363|nr:uncharacterized protein LOC123132554 [Triticum aestivum]